MTVPTARLIVFVIAYVALAFPMISGIRLSRPVIAAGGAALMLLVGRLPLHEAYAAVDIDVLVFLLGMLIAAAYLEVAGVFDWAAAGIIRHVTDNPYVLLAVLVGVSGLASALFMNDTICLVFPPLVVVTLRPLGLKPAPFLLGVALAANVGSAMAITGNPQNMVIGLASHIGYAAFLAALVLPSLGGLLIVYGVLALVFHRDLTVLTGPPAPVVARAIDRRAAIVATAVFAGMLVGWLLGYSLPLVSIVGGVALLVLAGREVGPVLGRVDWLLLVFFVGLFVIVGGVRDVPLVERGTAAAVHALNGRPWRDATVVSGVMLVLSNVISNVPAVLLWRPVIPTLPDARFLWLVLAMSATFAGNLTLLGSLANLIVAERAAAKGATLSFADFLKAGVPVTLLTIGWGVVALVLVAGR
jgi:Na+/H+ antiporter NhaD/arsenite permease-like protein